MDGKKQCELLSLLIQHHHLNDSLNEEKNCNNRSIRKKADIKHKHTFTHDTSKEPICKNK
jgi:hypothetical protein